jgi:S1-C subfamily serine protease
MRKVVLVIVVLLIIPGLAFSGNSSDEERDVRVNDAHKALQEAVERVRVLHAPEANVFFADGEALFLESRRPRIGVVVRTSDFGDEPAGAVIDAVTPGSPADEAGLRAGDVITHVDGRLLVDEEAGDVAKAVAARELVEWSRGLEDGQQVTVDYIRDGSPASVSLEAREMDTQPHLLHELRRPELRDGDLRRFALPPAHWTFPSAWLDMEMVALNPELGEYFNTDRGVLVVRAPSDDSIGLEAGDVILSIDGREVHDPSHAMRILRSYESDEELTLSIVRHGRSQTLTGTVPEPSVELFSGRGGYFVHED